VLDSHYIGSPLQHDSGSGYGESNMTQKGTLIKKKKLDKKTYILFVLPAVIAYSLVEIVPFLQGLYYSFTDWSGISINGVNFIGLQNYIDAFHDERFGYSAIITFSYGIVNFLVSNTLQLCG
jgi:raffinose/stachyose/melibiose transport system permease protein